MKSFKLLILLFLTFASARAENLVFPVGSGAVDITQPPYNAVPDGVTDCTYALQTALAQSKNLIYLPNGIYLVSEQLRWGGAQTRIVLQGQSEAGTIIKLKDGAPGYGDPAEPDSVIWTGQKPAQRFRNGIRNLTVDTGSNNPGAIGVQFIANNQGGMRHVTIRSGDGAGVIGLDLGYTDEQGPSLFKDIRVIGFDIGISTKFGVDGVVFSDITVEGQNDYGFVNDGQCVSIRGLHSANAVPAFFNKSGSGLVALLDSEITGTPGASSQPAIINTAGMFVRNLTTTGHSQAIENRLGTRIAPETANVVEWTSHSPLSLFPSPPKSLNLPIVETPEVPYAPLTDWVSVTDYAPVLRSVTRSDGNVSNKWDWSGAVQQAIDSGKSHVYFPAAPAGRPYFFTEPVIVRGNVSRITGMEQNSWLDSSGYPNPEFIIDGGTAPVVVIESMDVTYASPFFRHRGNRTLVIRNTLMNEYGRIFKEAGSGNLFLEDVATGQVNNSGGMVWATQLNLEGRQVRPKFLNDGGTLWLLGLKTEDDSLLLDNRNGAKAEICGGFIYANKDSDPTKVMFENNESSLSVTVGEFVIRNQPFNPVRETRDGVTRQLDKGVAPGRAGGSLIVLYTGYRTAGATAAPGAPGSVTATGATTSRIDLTWQVASGIVDGYMIDTSTNGTTFTQAATAAPDATSFPLHSGITANKAYWIRVSAFNSAGSTAAGVVQTTTLPISAAGSGTGLRGEYFSGKNFDTSAATRTDAQVSFDWTGGAAPPGGVSPSNMSVRWEGEVLPRSSDVFTFNTTRARTRLWVAGRLVVDAWSSGATGFTGAIRLEAGVSYPIRMEMWSDSTAAASATLTWSSANQSSQTIPQSQLFPATTILPVVKVIASIAAASESGPVNGAFVVSRTGSTAAPLPVALARTSSATPGLDYPAFSTAITIPAGEAAITIPVAVLDDLIWDAGETVVLEVPPSTAYSTAGTAASVSIADNDAPATSNGTGLRGKYFQLHDFTDFKGTRIDSRVDFNWGEGAPFPGVSPTLVDGYSIRWTGEIQPQFTARYRFALSVGGYAGERLWVNDQLVVNAWTSGTLDHGFIDLVAGQKVTIRVDFDQRNFYDGRIKLQWSNDFQALQTVPQSQLFPAADIPLPPEALSAATVSKTQIDLAWTDVKDNGTALEIEYRTGAGSFQPLVSLPPGTSSHSATGLAPGTLHTFRVRAVGPGGASAWSNEAAATTTPAEPAGLLLELSSATLSGTQNLTALGTADWVKWGRSGLSTDRKSGGNQIGGWTTIGTFTPSVASGSGVTHTWTGGTPTASGSNGNLVRTGGLGRGYEITAPADTSTRQFLVDVSTQYGATCKLEVTLDGFTLDPREVTVTGGSGVSNYRMTINYRSLTATTLRVRWTSTTSTGNVCIRAAALSVTAETSPYDLWSAGIAWGAIPVDQRDPDDDPDADGHDNFLERALGSNPTLATSTASPTLGYAGSSLQLTYFRAQPELTYTVERSTSVDTWTSTGVIQATSPVGQPATAAAPYDPETTPSLFLRLKVTEP